jgi:pyridoxine kinase
MRILAISSQVAYGPVGLTAAVPALQAKGHEVLALPTVTLSNHPGHGKPAGFRTEASDMAAMLAALRDLGALAAVDAVLTGYFVSAAQVDEAARAILSLDDPFVMVDPVLGDGQSLYVSEEVARAIRDLLLPLATCTTPNRFELEWLSGHGVTDEETAIAAARQLPAIEVLATSIPADGDRLATLAITPEGCSRRLAARLAAVPHGTGDFLAGLYLAERLAAPPEQALAAAMAVLERAIALSAGQPVLAVAAALQHADNRLPPGEAAR